jgi:hypothetical protein
LKKKPNININDPHEWDGDEAKITIKPFVNFWAYTTDLAAIDPS